MGSTMRKLPVNVTDRERDGPLRATPIYGMRSSHRKAVRRSAPLPPAPSGASAAARPEKYDAAEHGGLPVISWLLPRMHDLPRPFVSG
jgi:hypothetical protein